jgi:flagellar biosynthesis protein FlhG
MGTDEFERAELREPARTYAFISSKGGVGKTHLAVNLAARLSQEGRRVLLVDTDLGSANTDIRVGVSPTTTLLDFYEGKADISCCLTNTRHGFQILAGRPGDFAMANLPDEQIVRLLKAFDELVRKGGYNDIFFDLGAGISSRVLDFALVSDEIIIVATPTEIVHAYAALKACWTRLLGLQDHEYFREHAALSKTPYYMRNNYQGDKGAPRINFIVNQVDNIEQGQKVYLAITRVAKTFFYTEDGYWKLLMRYLGAVPDVHDFLKRAEMQRLPAIVLNPHHEFSHAIVEVANILLAKRAIPPSKLRITFGDRVKSVIRTWGTA